MNKRFRIYYKTSSGSGMVKVWAIDEHQARYKFTEQYKMPYGAIKRIEIDK